jgi:hypothetical protein
MPIGVYLCLSSMADAGTDRPVLLFQGRRPLGQIVGVRELRAIRQGGCSRDRRARVVGTNGGWAVVRRQTLRANVHRAEHPSRSSSVSFE